MTTGVDIDGIMAEGGAQSWTTLVVPVMGVHNRFSGVYAEQTSDFQGVSVAIGPQFCAGTGGTSPKPKGTVVAEDNDCANPSTGGSAATAPNAEAAYTNGVLDLDFMHPPSAIVAPAKGILLGNGCIEDKLVRIRSAGHLEADSAGNEFTVASAISGENQGCTLQTFARAQDESFPAYANLDERWSKRDDTLYAEQYIDRAEDLFAAVRQAIDAATVQGLRGGVVELPRGQFTVTGGKLDLCNEEGRQFNPGWQIRGQGAGIEGFGGTRIVAGAGFTSAVVSRTNYTVTAGGGDGGRDIIECVGCDFRAAGITRGSLIETTNFASAGNNYSRTTGKMALKVYRAETTRLTVEDERSIHAGLVNVTSTTSGSVRLLKPMIEVCGSNSWITDIELDGEGRADMLVHHRPDNTPSVECTAASTPYASCTGAGTGSGLPLVTVNGGVDRVWGYDPTYYGIASTAPESSGQADHWGVHNSHFWGGVGSIWYDGLQAQPGFTVEATQMEAFKTFGFRLSSGSGILDDTTIISADADCRAGTYGQCAHVWMSYENVVGLHLKGSNNIEARAGSGIHVVDGGSVPGAIRSLTLDRAVIQANDTTSPTNFALIHAPNACLQVDLGNSYFKSIADPVNPPTVTFGNANQATCQSSIIGSAYFFDSGSLGPPPVLTINDSIPQTVMSSPTTDNAIMRSDGTRGAIQGSGASIDDAGNLTANSVNTPDKPSGENFFELNDNPTTQPTAPGGANVKIFTGSDGELRKMDATDPSGGRRVLTDRFAPTVKTDAVAGNQTLPGRFDKVWFQHDSATPSASRSRRPQAFKAKSSASPTASSSGSSSTSRAAARATPWARS